MHLQAQAGSRRPTWYVKNTLSIAIPSHRVQIAVTSVTPVAGRFCQIFSPRTYLFISVIIFSTGLFVSSVASRLAIFLLGRAILGVGAAAVTPVALILVADLTSQKRRGLFVGLVNTGYTTGVAFGAIIAGALEPAVGWVMLPTVLDTPKYPAY